LCSGTLGPCTQLSLDYWVGPPHACPWGGSSHAPLTPRGGEPSPPSKFFPFIKLILILHNSILFSLIQFQLFMGEGPLDPPSLRGGPAGNDLVCLVGVSGMSFLVARVPRTPHGPVGGRAVNTCLPCSVVSVMPSGLWRGSPNPQPRLGPTVSNLVALGHIGPSYSSSSGPPVRFLTDTLGGRNIPSPSSSSHVLITSRLWPLPFSALWGPLSFSHLPPLYHVGPPPSSIGPPIKSPSHPRGGRGAGHALPYPPTLPPSSRILGLGGGGPINPGPLSFSHGGEGPSAPSRPVWGWQ